MSQVADLLETIKRYLAARGITYGQLGKELGLSESSVKRSFSKKSFSLHRIEEICTILGLDILDLALMSRQMHRTKPSSLTIEQEQELALDPRLTLFFYFLLNGWPITMIREEYHFTRGEITDMLVRLERLGVIDIHSDEDIRLKVSKNIFWNKDGPLWQSYVKRIMSDFFDDSFTSPGSRLEFGPGQLSEASLRIILKRIDALFREFNELAEKDMNLPIKERYSTGMIVAFRPWVFDMIANLKKGVPDTGLSL